MANNGVMQQLIRNPVTASRTGGVSVTVTDAAGRQKYGDRSYSSPTTQDQDDASVRDRATWLLARYKELARKLHPDHGGSNAEMAKVNQAYSDALREVRAS